MRLRSRLPFKWFNFLGAKACPRPFANQSGQVVLEYVLLLVIVTSLGAVIIKGLVSRNQDEPGLLVAKWHSIIKTIAADNPEE
jgi:hypothetical protein